MMGGTMDLPPTYFYKLAQSPLLIFNGQLFQLVKGEADDKNKVHLNGEDYKLHESETLEELENLYYTDFIKEIDRLKTDYLNNKLASSMNSFKNKKLETLEQSKLSIEKNSAIWLALDKVMPGIDGENPLKNIKLENIKKISDIGKVKNDLAVIERGNYDSYIGKNNIRMEDSIGSEDLVISEKKSRCCKAKVKVIEMDDEGTAYKCKKCRKECSVIFSYFENLFNFGMVVMDNTVYFLVKEDKKDYCIINKKKYGIKLNNVFLLNNMEQRYIESLKILFRKHALEECDKRFEELDKILFMENVLKKIIREEEHEGKNGGFYRTERNRYTFYIHFPQFVNKFPNGGYYLFPEGKMSIGVDYSPRKNDFIISTHTDEEGISVDDITVLSKYIHPFTSPIKDKDDESSMCTGSYKLSSDIITGWKEIPMILIHAKTILMNSYHGEGNHPNLIHHHKNYSYTRVTKKWAEKNKIPITNIKSLLGGKNGR